MTFARFVQICFLPVISFCFSSCFQFIEEVNVRSNGSGDVKLTINLSQSKSKVASLLLLDSVNGHKVPTEKDIRKYMNEAVTDIKKYQGISNVAQSLDMKNYIATISFSFTDVSNLNNIIRKLTEKNKIKSSNFASYSYDKQTKVFKRDYQYSSETKAEYNKLKADDKNVFKTATYTSIFRFEETITANSNKLSKMSPSGKALMLNVPAMDLINGKTNISNNIQLAK